MSELGSLVSMELAVLRTAASWGLRKENWWVLSRWGNFFRVLSLWVFEGRILGRCGCLLGFCGVLAVTAIFGG